jgi:hypothetical protein
MHRVATTFLRTHVRVLLTIAGVFPADRVAAEWTTGDTRNLSAPHLFFSDDGVSTLGAQPLSE